LSSYHFHPLSNFISFISDLLKLETLIDCHVNIVFPNCLNAFDELKYNHIIGYVNQMITTKVKIHEVAEMLADLGGNKAKFCELVGAYSQNMSRYISGYVVIERAGKYKLDKEEFWREK